MIMLPPSLSHLAYRPTELCLAQPSPLLTTPMSTALSPVRVYSGPPESPCTAVNT